jgi:hypothetical protein
MSALILTFSPGRRNSGCSLPVLRVTIRQIQSQVFEKAAKNPPSPWGEGRGEGGRWLKLCERQLAQTCRVGIITCMSAQEILLEEIKHQPEPVLREVLHYLKFLTRTRAEEAWADLTPSREVEQEVLDILDGKAK